MASLRSILCVSLAILSICCASKAFKIQSRIVGGSDAKREDHPHNVAFLIENGIVMCGGSILSDRVILSTASCVKNFVDTPYELFASFQSDVMLDDETDGATIEKIVLHPSYSEKYFTNDLALLKTTEEIQFTPQVQPIELTTSPLPSDDGQMVTISGWGFMQDPSDALQFPKLADHLQFHRTTTMELHKCMRLFAESKGSNGSEVVSRLGVNNICTENAKNEGICIGDMGNALVSEDGKLAAVATWTFGCGRGLPDVYTKAFPYLDWIKNGMQTI